MTWKAEMERHMLQTRLVWQTLCMLLLGLAVGCGPKPVATPTKVKGHVLGLNGTPLNKAKVEFVPFPFSDMKKPEVGCPFALTSDTGEFRLWNGFDDEVDPRRFKVTIRSLVPDNRVPKAYRDPETTPLDITVPKEGFADLVLQIQ